MMDDFHFSFQSDTKPFSTLVSPQKTKSDLNFQRLDALDLVSHDQIKKNMIKALLDLTYSPERLLQSDYYLQRQKKIEEKAASLWGFPYAFFTQNDPWLHRYLLDFFIPSNCIIFMDRGCHPQLCRSVIESNARVVWYDHNNTNHLKELLKQSHAYKDYTKIILTESLFSMTGDLCYLSALSAYAEDYDCLLYVEDSTSFSVMGEQGLGLCCQKKGVDLVVSSFGLSFTSLGKVVFCSSEVYETLSTRSFDFEMIRTLPPTYLGGIDALLEKVPDLEIERQRVQKNAQYMRKNLKDKGFEIGNCCSHLIPLLFESKEEALLYHDFLSQNHIHTLFQPMGESLFLIKFIVQDTHTRDELDLALHTLTLFERPLSSSAVKHGP